MGKMAAPTVGVLNVLIALMDTGGSERRCRTDTTLDRTQSKGEWMMGEISEVYNIMGNWSDVVRLSQAGGKGRESKQSP